MKKMLLAFIAICSISLNAQLNSLRFDGDDDYCTIVNQGSNGSLDKGWFTMEAVITSFHSDNEYQTIYANQEKDEEWEPYFFFGLDKEGWLTLIIEGYTYNVRDKDLRDEKCHHVAFSVEGETVTLYIDGQIYWQGGQGADHQILNQDVFYVGNMPWHQGLQAGFNGTIEEWRAWKYARDPHDVDQWSFTSLQMWPMDMFFYFPTDEGQGINVYDHAAAYSQLGYLGMEPVSGVDLTPGLYPKWIEEACVEPVSYPNSNRIGSQPINCVPNGPNLICNGDFEQYDPILNTVTGLGIMDYYKPFVANASGYSDFANWTSNPNATNVGPGPGAADHMWAVLPSNATFSQATDAAGWNAPASNNAYLGFEHNFIYGNTHAPTSNYVEGNLDQALDPTKSYLFSFYGLVDYYTNGAIKVSLLEANGTAHLLQEFQLLAKPVGATVASWNYYSLVFNAATTTTPLVGIRIEGGDPSGVPQGFGGQSTFWKFFVDEFSIVEVVTACANSQFPQAIEMVDHHNQRYQRFTGVDATDNIYVAGNSYEQFNAFGYFLKKYDPCGGSAGGWTIPVSNTTYRNVTAMCVDDLGNTYLALLNDNVYTTIIKKYTPSGTVAATSGLMNGRINSMAFQNNQADIVAAFTPLNGQGNPHPTVAPGILKFSSGNSGVNTVASPLNLTQKSAYGEIFQIIVDSNDDVFIAGNPTTTWGEVNIEKLDGATLGALSPQVDNKLVYENPIILISPYNPSVHARSKVQQLYIDNNDDLYVVGGYNYYLKVNNSSPLFEVDMSPYGSTQSRTGYVLKLDGNNLTLDWGKSLGPNLYNTINPVTSISGDPNGNVVVAGIYNKLKANGQTYSTGSGNSAENFLISYDAQGTFRWFDATQDQSGYTQFYFPDHCASISYQSGIDAYVVAGNFRSVSTELFDHGTLTTNSTNNVFVCHAIDQGTSAVFSETNGQTDYSSSNGNHNSYGIQLSSREEVTNGIGLYPNPTNGIFTLEIPVDRFEQGMLKVTSLDGRTVYSITLSTPKTKIDLQGVGKGVYLLYYNSNVPQKIFVE